VNNSWLSFDLAGDVKLKLHAVEMGCICVLQRVPSSEQDRQAA